MSKRFFASLLAGGATTIAISFGSWKINDNKDQNNKIINHKKAKKNFSKYKLTSSPKGGEYYLPDYSDTEAWKQTYRTKHVGDGRKEFETTFQSWESFREYCYSKGQNDKEKCNDVAGWCIYCARNTGWKWDKERNIKS